MVLILLVGLYLSFSTGFAQIRLLPKALKSFAGKFHFRNLGDNGVSSFQALCTALAATVGTGNLAGVAGAIALGGPGALFWMWVCAFLGMVTKFAEVTLAVKYRCRNKAGEYVGGPMHMIQNGLGRRWHWLAFVYCFFGVIASFGVGNATQINAVLESINSVVQSYGGNRSVVLSVTIGIIFAILISIMLMGGARRIGKASQILIPFVSIVYVVLCFGVLIYKAADIPGAVRSVIVGAFDPRAVTGGMLGSLYISMRIGASRGVFTNEAGMGTASIAHASAKVSYPTEQGMMGIVEVFLDTIVICTLTGLVILCSGCVIPYGTDVGVSLTTDAFSVVYGRWVNIAISFSLCCFAVGTILGWGLYGARCAEFLFGASVWKPFVFCQAVVIVVSSFLQTDTIWLLSETINGLMAIPNLLALTLLSPKLRQLTVRRKQMC